MPLAKDSYDFECGNEKRHLNFAIKHNAFHTITIQADIAKLIDFSGGTKKVETIRLRKCFKTTRIIWPEYTGNIKRLYISNCDSLRKLDVSALTNLDEISILNCHHLENITGLSPTIKEINIHHSKVSAIHIAPDSRLQKMNVSTFSPKLHINVKSQPELQIIYCEILPRKTQNGDLLIVNAKDCKSLHTGYFDASHGSANVNLANCTILKELAVISDKASLINGLNTCKNIRFLSAMHFEAPDLGKPELKLLTDTAQDVRATNEKLHQMAEISRSFYKQAQDNVTTISDRETTIQQSGAGKDAERDIGIKIIMLGSPEYLIEETDVNEMTNFSRKVKVDDTFFLANLQSALFFLPNLPYAAIPATALPYARVLNFLNPDESISLWRSNRDRLIPNILLVRSHDIVLPEVEKVLREFHDRALVRGHHQPFDYHQIVITGDQYYVANRLPYLAPGIVRVPPSAMVTPSAVNAAITHSSYFERESKTIENISQLAGNQKMSGHFKAAARDFIHNLQIHISKTRLGVPDSTPIDAGASHEDVPDLQGRNAKQAPIKHQDVPRSTPIDAGASHEDVPELQGRNAKQAPIKHQDVPRSTPIDAGASHEDVPEFHGMKSNQSQIEAHKRSEQLKEAKPLKPEETPQQFSLQKDIKVSEQKNAPPLNPNPARQQFLFHQPRKAMEDLPEQHLIDASAETLSDSDTALLVAARSFAKALKSLVDAIPSTKTPNTNEFKAATDYITQLNRESYLIEEDEPPLYAANKLFNAIDLLDSATQQSPKVQHRTEINSEHHESEKQRRHLQMILINALSKYQHDHNTDNRSDDYFGEKKNKETIRAKMLEKLVTAVSNNQQINIQKLNVMLNELMKDKGLSYALGGITDELKEILTNSPPTSKPLTP